HHHRGDGCRSAEEEFAGCARHAGWRRDGFLSHRRFPSRLCARGRLRAASLHMTMHKNAGSEVRAIPANKSALFLPARSDHLFGREPGGPKAPAALRTPLQTKLQRFIAVKTTTSRQASVLSAKTAAMITSR